MSTRALYCIVSLLLLLSAALQAQQMQDPDFFELERRETSDGGYVFSGSNTHIIPIFVRFSFQQLRGLEADRELPVQVVIPPETDGYELVRLKPTGGRSISFRSSALSARGDPFTVDHDNAHLYLLPFEHGRKYRVTQGYNGPFTHTGVNQYAIDFDLEEGDPVHATRSGIVVEVKQDSRTGGIGAHYADSGNYILILHSDGSFGNYAHLEYNGSLVAVGDRVDAGDAIGRSGNTGQSSGPHLHFDVRIPTTSGRMQSIPITFRDHEGQPVTLEAGGHYYAAHPGGEPFEVVFGADLSNEDFEGHRRRIETGTIDMRTEQIDSTFVLFLQNGTDQRLTIETTLQLRGMDATTPRNIESVVEPNTEIFLSIVRARPGVRSFQYGYQFRYREAP